MSVLNVARNKCPSSALIGVSNKRVEFREMKGFSPGTKKTVRNNEVSVKRGLTVSKSNPKRHFFFEIVLKGNRKSPGTANDRFTASN